MYRDALDVVLARGAFPRTPLAAPATSSIATTITRMGAAQ